MIPKIIHLCWFSDDPYPVEIKVCLESWKRVLPDFEIRKWGMAEARAIDCQFLQEALDNRRWAFAADVVRFYAVYTEGGIYMDSDVFMYRRFDEFMKDGEPFFTFAEKIYPEHRDFGLQAAFFGGEAGNEFCREALEYYYSTPYVNPDGTFNELISPFVMVKVAERHGWKVLDEKQRLDIMTVYPSHFVAPRKRYPIDKETIAQHRVYGSWRKRKFGRRIEIAVKHVWNVIRYVLFKR